MKVLNSYPPLCVKIQRWWKIWCFFNPKFCFCPLLTSPRNTNRVFKGFSHLLKFSFRDVYKRNSTFVIERKLQLNPDICRSLETTYVCNLFILQLIFVTAFNFNLYLSQPLTLTDICRSLEATYICNLFILQLIFVTAFNFNLYLSQPLTLTDICRSLEATYICNLSILQLIFVAALNVNWYLWQPWSFPVSNIGWPGARLGNHAARQVFLSSSLDHWIIQKRL